MLFHCMAALLTALIAAYSELYSNNLTGSIPSALGNLKSLSRLYVARLLCCEPQSFEFLQPSTCS